MKQIIILFTILLSSANMLFANDGAYYLSGNQLIPIQESDISVTKEILSIRREGDFIYVTVDYTFFNPTSEKTILVGFEANSPSGGGVDTYPKKGKHPYIDFFNVKMNNKPIAHKVAIVDKKDYFIKGKIAAKTEKEVTTTEDYIESEVANFFYVYYFNATFKPGENKLIHTYKYTVSSSVIAKYSIDYILTAAMRWANKQIDDFTLNIDMGNNENFNIAQTFFSGNEQWQMENGVCVEADTDSNNLFERYLGSKKKLQLVTYSGGATFKAKNFKPQGEFNLWAELIVEHNFDYKKNNLPASIYNDGKVLTKTYPLMIYPPHIATDKESYKILRNLPYAIRGYIFRTPYIQEYYEQQKWYTPNAEYKNAAVEHLTKEEKQWIESIRY